MPIHPMPLPRHSIAALLAAAIGLAGCAAASQPVQWRLQVRAAADWPDAQRFADEASVVAGVPVRPDPVAIAPHWYAITLECESRPACKHAAMKLAAQPSLVVELRRDEQQRIPSRPSSEASR